MKQTLLIIAAFTTLNLFGQSLPFTFEGDISTSDFVDFDGGVATVIPNPQSKGINTSQNVAQIVRNGGAVWSGSKIILSNNLDFSSNNAITMKVYTTAPIGTVVKLKLETTGGSKEIDVTTSVSGEWETLKWDYTGTPADFNVMAFMFDFGNVGDGSANSTFLFDDVQQIFGGYQIDLPVDFEGNQVNYATTSFEGNMSELSADPENASNTVVKVTKPVGATTAGGTTIGTNAGFASDIPLTIESSKMNVMVWSPDANIPVRLKVEDSNDPTHTCETEVRTTKSQAWEKLVFDFTNEAPGTVKLSAGLQQGWTYNMASIFFNFGTDGATAGEKVYYFDDVSFGVDFASLTSITAQQFSIYPNPAQNVWNLKFRDNQERTIQLYNNQGQILSEQQIAAEHFTMEATSLPRGIYFCTVQTSTGSQSVKLIK